jgi:serine-type D-Ala-D-Ala carboxypeptidase/endopeptidase (penicillin-binding protein 4)
MATGTRKRMIELNYYNTYFNMMNKKIIIFLFCLNFFLLSFNYLVAQVKQISKEANKILLQDSAVATGHIGISIYEPQTNTYWYNYNEDKYFIPASNIKLFSLYAGMKYLGDSLVGIRYTTKDCVNLDNKNLLKILGTGDPTFLHPKFKQQPVYNFLKANADKTISLNEIIPNKENTKSYNALASGWAWDDYLSSDMAERSYFPIYGNVVSFSIVNKKIQVSPSFFTNKTFILSLDKNITVLNIERPLYTNSYSVKQDTGKYTEIEIPIKMGFDANTNIQSVEGSLLSDTLHQSVGYGRMSVSTYTDFKTIHSQPSDSLFKQMMHNSNNFFAEQTLLMASNEFLGYMNDEKMIDTILNSSLKDLPQRPKWVDGSGLSRYNLATPQSIVFILNKMKTEFGLQRMKTILPTGGSGTITKYYKKDAGYIFAKTGTLSNNCALSGYLITKKGKLLIFSILTNNYITGATPIRKAMEKFLQGIREAY